MGERRNETGGEVLPVLAKTSLALGILNLRRPD
jgi:hypothetical protein